MSPAGVPHEPRDDAAPRRRRAGGGRDGAGCVIRLGPAECAFAERKAAAIAEATKGWDGSAVRGASYFNNLYGTRGELAFAQLVGLPAPDLKEDPDGRGDGGVDFRLLGMPGAEWERLGLDRPFTVDVKSAIHGYDAEVQIFRSHWPLRSRVIVVTKPVRVPSTIVTVRGWALAEEIERTARKGTPRAPGFEEWQPNYWFPAGILRSMFEGPWCVTVYPPETIGWPNPRRTHLEPIR